MPNWVANGVKISHPKEEKIKWLTNHVIHEGEEEKVFDFEKIIEMPKELKDTKSPSTIVKTQAEADKINKENESKPFDPGNTISEKESKELKEKYGADNWYDWQYNNWGVKWGASDLKVVNKEKNSIDVEFNTPWGTPEGVWQNLADKGFSIYGVWQDEDPSSNGYIDYGNDNDSQWYINSTVERW